MILRRRRVERARRRLEAEWAYLYSPLLAYAETPEEEVWEAYYQGRVPRPGPVLGRKHAVTGELIEDPSIALIPRDLLGWFEAVWSQQDSWDAHFVNELTGDCE